MKSLMHAQYFKNFMGKNPEVRTFMIDMYKTDVQARKEFNSVVNEMPVEPVFKKKSIDYAYNVVGWSTFWGLILFSGQDLLGAGIIGYFLPAFVVELPAFVINAKYSSKTQPASALIQNLAKEYDNANDAEKITMRNKIKDKGLKNYLA